jgi:hypothetical protein
VVSITDMPAAMRVRISDPALLGDLQRYLRAAVCVAEQSEENALDVHMPRAPSEEQARREIDDLPQSLAGDEPERARRRSSPDA